MSSIIELSVFTLNVWGLPDPISKKKSRRISEIGQFINTKNYDVVCFQELWCKTDYCKLKEICREKLPYSHYYYSGVFGSGLSIFSKWPILKTFFAAWSVNGYFHMVHHGDWFGGKGVALAQINVDDHIVNIYNTHLIAKYHRDDIYLTHRVIQAFDAGLFIDLTSAGADLIVVCGDFNSSPDDICSRLIQSVAQLQDTHCATECNGKEQLGTSECSSNSFSIKHESLENDNGSRIDYIFFKSCPSFQSFALSYDLPLSHRIPGTNFSYSDHEAVEAKLCVDKEVISDSINTNIDLKVALLRDAAQICSVGERTLKDSCLKYIIFAILFASMLFFFLNLTKNFHFLYYITLMPFMIYCLFMSSIWYKLEMNGIVGAKIRIQNYKAYTAK